MQDDFSKPPYSNTGAQNTNSSGLIACVDWLQVTFLHASNPFDIIDLLGLCHSDFKPMETGKYGYPFHLRFGHIALFYSDEKIGVHLEISGQGCREYESYNKYEWSVLFGLIHMLPVNISRLDLAIDDYKGYFKIATIYRKLKSSHATSKFKSFRYMVQARIKDKEITGQTVYLGSPQSRLMIRFYDKLAERKNKNFKVEDSITCWNRTELQLRDERAMSAAILLATEKYSTGAMIQGILKNYITFRNPTRQKDGSIDKNKSRWNVADFWDKFLGEVEKLSLTEKAPDKTIEQSKAWFDKNITATMSMLYEAFDNDEALIKEWLENGKEKMSKRHINMLETYRKQQEIYEENKRLKKINALGTRFDVNENGQIRPIAKKKNVKEVVKEIVEIPLEEYDKRIVELLKDKYEFKIKRESEQQDPNSQNN